MTRRTLPPLPHPQHLRKQAKARLAALRATASGARLTEAQQVLAREYGFADWTALQAEVANRAAGPHGRRAAIRRAHVAALYPERFRQDGLLDQESEIETHLGFFRAGVIAQIGFIFAALTGVALVFVAQQRPTGALAAMTQIGRPLARLLHAIF